MRYAVVASRMTLMLATVWACVGTSAQTTEGNRTADTMVARFFIEAAKKDSGYETGPLHIVYVNRTEIVKTLPPLQRKKTAFNAVGFSGVRVAEDRHTVGWTVKIANCCTSYSIPFSVVVFRRNQIVHTFEQGQMVWNWMFVERGKRVAVVFGPTHGTAVGDYRLYDVRTGKLISEVWGDEDTQGLRSDAPEWAKLLQKHPHDE